MVVVQQNSGKFKGIGLWKLPSGFVNEVSFSEDKKTSFTYLDCLWFKLHRKSAYETKVLTWIQKDIFQRNMFWFLLFAGRFLSINLTVNILFIVNGWDFMMLSCFFVLEISSDFIVSNTISLGVTGASWSSATLERAQNHQKQEHRACCCWTHLRRQTQGSLNQI